MICESQIAHQIGRESIARGYWLSDHKRRERQQRHQG